MLACQYDLVRVSDIKTYFLNKISFIALLNFCLFIKTDKHLLIILRTFETN